MFLKADVSKINKTNNRLRKNNKLEIFRLDFKLLSGILRI